MSLSDTKSQIEQTVIHPWQHFRTLTNALNQTHITSAKNFSDTMSGLLTGSDGDIAMQGTGADNLAALVGNYLSTTNKLTGTDPSHLCTRLEDAARICEKYASKLQQALDAVQPVQLAGAAAAVGGFAVDADIGAGAQLGVDVPWDIAAAGASLLALGLLAASANSDSSASSQAVSEKEIFVQSWDSEMESGPNTDPLPKLPPDPQGPSSNFLVKVLGLTAIVGITGAITYLVYKNWPVNPKQQISTLTPDELAALKEYLAQETGCSPAQIQKIIDQIMQQNPTGAQLQNILQALKLRTQMQTLVDEVNAAGNPQYAEFASGIQKVIGAITNTINDGTWTNSEFPTNVRTWQSNLNGFALQWQAAQTLGATALEQPMAGDSTKNADLVDQNKIWYEAKAYSTISRGDKVYGNILKQLYNYLQDQNYTTLDGRGIGVVVPADRMGKGIDWNLGTELLQDLKSKYPNNPAIKNLKQIYVKPNSLLTS